MLRPLCTAQHDPLPRRPRDAAALAMSMSFLIACSPDVIHSTKHVDTRVQAIVYGHDDRVDLYQADEPLAQLAKDTALALIAPELLRLRDDGDYDIDAPRYGELQSLCPGERFSDQPAAASCSGVLVAPDIVATSGHCLGVAADGSVDCTNNRYVFGFGITDPDAPIIVAADNVFECKRVLERLKTPSESSCRFDVALLELDRAARTAATAPFRDRPAQKGEEVVVIGFTAGLPVKIDRGGQVIDARREQGDFFTLSSDTFAVSSGSGVFDAEGELVGLFSRGRRDYDQDGSCQRVHREDEDGASGYEEATHIAAVQQLLTAVTSVEHSEPLDAGQACSPSDYVQTEPRARDGGADALRPATAASPSACTTAGTGIPGKHGGGPSCIAASTLLAALRRRRRAAANLRGARQH